eukprot:CAMPEP_0119410272 /NCGR_PEP_ID=MMETSP1335-20130426/3343_1 /TAXON_ID=259385 /ORGANISM="Chrysoculter rhomboideus, Strain RCC1486" /LENGTH=144 /DNA_ID=CAMNT_0007434769 /DNA_START=143 /DNA_END=577 /DNA_ORIENTATION=+
MRLHAQPLGRSALRAMADDGGTFAFGSFEDTDTARKLQDPSVKARVTRALCDACDNLRPAEVALVIDVLWAAGANAGREGVSNKRLIQLTEQIEQLEGMAARGEADPYALGDEARTIRSRMRMYARDVKDYVKEGEEMNFVDFI